MQPLTPRQHLRRERIEGLIAPEVKFELNLPANWNRRFYMHGNGGFAGSIQGMTTDMPAALRLGYATAGTDTGHQDAGGEWAIGHPEKMIDFGYRATHEMTVKCLAKAAN